MYMCHAGEATRLGFFKLNSQAKFTFGKHVRTWSNLHVRRGDGSGSPLGEHSDLTCILLGFL